MAVTTVSPRSAAPRTIAPQAAAQTGQTTQAAARSSQQSLRPAWSSPVKDGFAAAAPAAAPAPAPMSAAAGVDLMKAAAVGGRKLTADEKKVLQGVFGNGLNVDNLRVATAPQKVFDSLPRETPAFTVGNTIVVNPKYTLDNKMLVHEAAHAWQYQNGGADYLPKALSGQWFGQGYDWQKGLSSGRTFSTLNPEQQAQMIEDAYASGYFSGGGFKVGKNDYTSIMDAAMKDVRAGKGVSTTWDVGQ